MPKSDLTSMRYRADPFKLIKLHHNTVKPPYSAPHHAGMPLSGKICKRHQKLGLKDFEIILFLKVALYIHTN